MRTGIKIKVKPAHEKEKYILTHRETEYLSLAALGLRNRIIADKLYVTKSTVKKMLEIIFRKLKAKDRTNAVAIAFIHNLINSETLTYMSKIYLQSENDKNLE